MNHLNIAVGNIYVGDWPPTSVSEWRMRWLELRLFDFKGLACLERVYVWERKTEN